MLAVTKVLLDDPLPSLEEAPAADRSTAKTVSDVRRVHAPHWECFQTGGSLVVPASTFSHHTSTTTTTQRKRKRRDSDTEYTPHQKAGKKRSITPTIRRASRRLAVSTKLEEQPNTRFTYTERSSSSTSALTSASFNSFERLPTPEDLDISDSSVSTPEPKPRTLPLKRPRTEIGWIEEMYWGPGATTSAKIGFPPKEKRIDRKSSASTSHDPVKVGDWLRPAP